MAAYGKLLGRSTWSLLKAARSQVLTARTQPCLTRFASTHSDDNKTAVSKPEQSSDYLQDEERFKDISKPDENWVYHGYNPYDREEDLFWHHHTMFFMITIAFVGSVFMLMNYPDHKLVHWKQREAYLELERREKNGLPLIDPNLVPTEKMKQFLPSDEELGDTEIII